MRSFYQLTEIYPENEQAIIDMTAAAVNASVNTVVEWVRVLQRAAPSPLCWVVYGSAKAHSLRLPMHRRKLQPYIRKAWR